MVDLCHGEAMTPPMTPREKVRQIIDDALNSAIPEPWEVANHATDRIFTALASGSGDHAELERLAEAATAGPWETYPEAFSPRSFVIPTHHASDDPAVGSVLSRQDAAFIAAANPATVVSILAENAALRDREKSALKECSDWARQAGEAIGKLEASEMAGVVDGWRDRSTEAERQRDELRRALERIADEAPYRSGYCQSDVEYGPTLSADEMQAVARQALANQGADQ